MSRSMVGLLEATVEGRNIAFEKEVASVFNFALLG